MLRTANILGSSSEDDGNLLVSVGNANITAGVLSRTGNLTGGLTPYGTSAQSIDSTVARIGVFY